MKFFAKRYLKKYKNLEKDPEITPIDEYLADDISLGGKAKSGDIDYLYANSWNTVIYFKILVKKDPKFKILCIPDFISIYKKYIDLADITYIFNKDNLIIPKDINKHINVCMEDISKRFIYFSFGISLDIKGEIISSHANIVLIDKKNKTIERFEPLGQSCCSSINKCKKTDIINDAFKDRLIPKLKLENYSYISPFDISPEKGVQVKGDSYKGMCLTISMLYLHLRIINPDAKQTKVMNYLLSKSDKDLKNTILKYAKHVENTLKNNKDLVNDIKIDINDAFQDMYSESHLDEL